MSVATSGGRAVRTHGRCNKRAPTTSPAVVDSVPRWAGAPGTASSTSPITSGIHAALRSPRTLPSTRRQYTTKVIPITTAATNRTRSASRSAPNRSAISPAASAAAVTVPIANTTRQIEPLAARAVRCERTMATTAIPNGMIAAQSCSAAADLVPARFGRHAPPMITSTPTNTSEPTPVDRSIRLPATRA